MDEYYLAQIFHFAGMFAPRNFSYCNGDLIPITQNEGLYSILGVSYGGDARTNFGLPNLQGRVLTGSDKRTADATYPIGTSGGAFRTTLSVATMPAHNHAAILSFSDSMGTSAIPIADGSVGGSGNLPANPYSSITLSESNRTVSSPTNVAVTSVGEAVPFTHYQPLISIDSIICLSGLYPAKPS